LPALILQKEKRNGKRLRKFDLHGGFLGRVFQKGRNQKPNDGVFLGTIATFQNCLLKNILYGGFREIAHSGDFFKTFLLK
jgi:hypothetical protein